MVAVDAEEDVDDEEDEVIPPDVAFVSWVLSICVIVLNIIFIYLKMSKIKTIRSSLLMRGDKKEQKIKSKSTCDVR